MHACGNLAPNKQNALSNIFDTGSQLKNMPGIQVTIEIDVSGKLAKISQVVKSEAQKLNY